MDTLRPMLRCPQEIAAEAWEEAVAGWKSKWPPYAKYPDHVFAVSPNEGRSQSPVEATAFACVLFGQFVRLLAPPKCTLFVTFPGLDKHRQQDLWNNIGSPHKIEKKSQFSLDFCACMRESTSLPWRIELAMESEMKPVSAEGTDPEILFPDLVKLLRIRASHRVYFGRFNSANERFYGSSVPKRKRIDSALQCLLKHACELPGVGEIDSTTVIMAETARGGPWWYSIHTVLGSDESSYQLDRRPAKPGGAESSGATPVRSLTPPAGPGRTPSSSCTASCD